MTLKPTNAVLNAKLDTVIEHLEKLNGQVAKNTALANKVKGGATVAAWVGGGSGVLGLIIFIITKLN